MAKRLKNIRIWSKIIPSIKIRFIDKSQNLNSKKDVVKMANEYRDHNCGELNIKNVGEEVKLAGWIQRIRNLGGMTFVDLRDQYGITQIVISNEELKEQIGKDLVFTVSYILYCDIFILLSIMIVGIIFL